MLFIEQSLILLWVGFVFIVHLYNFV